MPEERYLDSALYVSSLESARFSWAGREYTSRMALDEQLATTLFELELEPEAYGAALYDAVFQAGSEVREGLREAIVAAEQEKCRLRFLLHLAPTLPDWCHGLFWELLTDNARHLALARSPDTAFSRYLGVRRAPGAPSTRRPRLLCVISAPIDSQSFGLAEIRRSEVVERLRKPFGMLAEAVDIAILEPPATLGRLREKLMEQGGFHLLHFFGHGHKGRSAAELAMEDDQGRAHFVAEELLAELFLGVRELRLVTLVACHGGAPSSSDPFSGLAGRLVQRGLPAVVAMRREVSVEDAHLFTNHFYGHLVQTGRADAAINEARQQLYLAHPRGLAWSSPVLYSRLTDGRLWLPPEGATESERPVEVQPRFRGSWHRLRHPLPWLPAALVMLLLVLGLWPARRAEARLDLWVSRLSFRLAETATIVERLRLQELAATQLAALRLPRLFSDAGGPLAGRRATGFRLATRTGAAAQITFNPRPLPAGTRIALDHLGREGDDVPEAYRLSVEGSPDELGVSVQGDVVLKVVDAPPVTLHFEQPDALALLPQSRSLDLDIVLREFAGDELARDIAIDDLALLRIVEQHEVEHSVVREESALLGGTVHLRATGRQYFLKRGESLRFADSDGVLTEIRLGRDGLRCTFQGSLGRLERSAPRLGSESLMPSVLDLGLARPKQRVLLWTLGALAVLTPFLTVLQARLHGKDLR